MNQMIPKQDRLELVRKVLEGIPVCVRAEGSDEIFTIHSVHVYGLRWHSIRHDGRLVMKGIILDRAGIEDWCSRLEEMGNDE